MGEKKIIKVFILILLGAALAFYLGSQCAKRDLKINIGNDKWPYPTKKISRF